MAEVEDEERKKENKQRFPDHKKFCDRSQTKPASCLWSLEEKVKEKNMAVERSREDAVLNHTSQNHGTDLLKSSPTPLLKQGLLEPTVQNYIL